MYFFGGLVARIIIIFHFSSVIYFFHRRIARIKKTYLAKVDGSTHKPKGATFPEPVGHFGAPKRHFGFCRGCGIASGEQMTLAPLSWYYYRFHATFSKSKYSVIADILYFVTYIHMIF